MSVINCYYITNVTSAVCEMVRTRDLEGVNVENLKTSIFLSQQQLIGRFQYPADFLLSANNCDWFERFNEGSTHLIYIDILIST